MFFGDSTVDCFDVCDAYCLVCLSQGAAVYLVYVVQYLTELWSLLFQGVITIFVIIPLAVFAVFDPCLPILCLSFFFESDWSGWTHII